jgi:hypothetical protein
MDKLEELLKSIQQKIEDFLKPLLKKLPLKNNTSSDEDDDATEVTAVASFDDEDRKKKDKVEGDDDEGEDEESSTDRLQQIKEIAPKVVLGLILFYLILDNFFLTNNEPNIEVKTSTTKVIEKKVQPKNEVSPTEATPATKKPIETKVDKEPEQVVSDIPPETSMDLVVKKQDKPEVSEPIQEEKMVFDNLEVINDDKQEVKEQEKGKDELGERLDEMVEDVKTRPIDEAVGYVAPPSYQRFGRGLVYNCQGKYWACVNQYSYIKCRENNKYNLDNSKKPECVIKNVYASDDDCIKVQKYYVNNNESTSFCSSPITK